MCSPLTISRVRDPYKYPYMLTSDWYPLAVYSQRFWNPCCTPVKTRYYSGGGRANGSFWDRPLRITTPLHNHATPPAMEIPWNFCAPCNSGFSPQACPCVPGRRRTKSYKYEPRVRLVTLGVASGCACRRSCCQCDRRSWCYATTCSSVCPSTGFRRSWRCFSCFRRRRVSWFGRRPCVGRVRPSDVFVRWSTFLRTSLLLTTWDNVSEAKKSSSRTRCERLYFRENKLGFSEIFQRW